MSGLVVKLKKGQRVDNALRILKKRMLKEGIFEEIRERKYYVKPSQKKQRKKKEQKFKSYLKHKREKNL